tara:strand:- start:17108 stop:19273 length:2166 start_codon:yes stop_codon:yes gene_type:complete
MAIKYGKGLRGALGRMRDIESQYVGLPYKEMMTGNLMRQAAYDKSEETLDNISSLYDEQFIEKDQAILDQQRTGIEEEIGSMVDGVGGDLGKLTGKFSNLYRKMSSDRTYLNAKAQQNVRNEYIKDLRKLKLDQGMAQYYLDRSDNEYEGADKDYYVGLNPTNLTEAKLKKGLYDKAKAMKTTDSKVLTTYYDNIGNQVTKEYAETVLGEGNYRIARETRTVEGRSGEAMRENLLEELSLDGAYNQFTTDYAAMLGIDPDQYRNLIATQIAKSLQGKTKDTIGSLKWLTKEEDENKDQNTVPSSWNEAIQNVEHPLAEQGYLDVQGGYVGALTALDADQTLTEDQKAWIKSIYTTAAEEVYASDDPFAPPLSFDERGVANHVINSVIQKGLNQEKPGGTYKGKENFQYILNKYYTDANGNYTSAPTKPLEDMDLSENVQLTKNELNFPAMTRMSLKSSRERIYDLLSKEIEKASQEGTEAFQARVSELKTQAPEVKMLGVTGTEANKSTNIVRSLLDSGIAKIYSEDGTLIDGPTASQSFQNPKIIKVSANPIRTGMGEDDLVRVLKISGKVGSGPSAKNRVYELRVPESQFQTALGTDKTINLFRNTVVEDYQPGFIYDEVMTLDTQESGTYGLTAKNEYIRQNLNRELEMQFEIANILPEGAIDLKLQKLKTGFSISGTLNINGELLPVDVLLDNAQATDEWYTTTLPQIIIQALTKNN